MEHEYNGIPGSDKKEGDILHSILFSEKGRVQKTDNKLSFIQETYMYLLIMK